MISIVESHLMNKNLAARGGLKHRIIETNKCRITERTKKVIVLQFLI